MIKEIFLFLISKFLYQNLNYMILEKYKNNDEAIESLDKIRKIFTNKK